MLQSISPESHQNITAVPRTCAILIQQEISIIEDVDATDLLQKRATRELTSIQVTTVFCKRAAIAQQRTCCLTETLFDGALARAKALDDDFAKTGALSGPLHGLPVSVKESFNIGRIQTCIGFLSFLDHEPARENSELINFLSKAGAVLYVKTDLPQTIVTSKDLN